MATERYDVDPSHTTIGFSARHLAVSTVRGQFGVFSGGVDVADGDPLTARGSAEIDIASISTNNAQRDAHLVSPDFFEAARFPKMTYRVTGVEKVTGETYRIVGDLTIKDVTKPLALEATVEARIADPFGGKERVGLSIRGQINRKEYGLVWDGLAGAIPVVSDTIKLDLDLALVSKATEPANA